MTPAMFRHIIASGMAEIREGRIHLTQKGYGLLLMLRYRANRKAKP